MGVGTTFRIEPRYESPSYLWPRPRYRGVIHALGGVVAIPFGLALLAATGGRARVAAAIYVVAQLTVFFTSAAYHLVAKTPTARRRMQLADHSMIYVLIVGTWVPLCLLVMPASRGRLFLGGIAAAAGIGIVLKLFGVHRFPKSSNTIYGVMGWAGLLALPSIVANMTGPELALLTAGGLAYSCGSLILMFKTPDPRPHEFGYHEVWHACTVLGAACHFAMVWMVAVV